MTMSFKLDAALEQRLRQHSLALGLPASQIIREALQAWLDDTPQAPASAYALGRDLFGQYAGPVDLASRRKQAAAEVWDAKDAARRA